MSLNLRRLFVVLSFLTPNVFGVSITDPVVDLGYAKYSGTFNAATTTTQFLGIRYAAPPTGWSTLALTFSVL